MRPAVLLLLFAACAALVCSLALAATLDCVFKASCNATDTTLLRAENDTGGYRNAHVQLPNSSASAYGYSLCCGTDATHWLNSSCANPNATVILNVSNSSDAHVQLPAINTYNYSACLALSPGGLLCEYVNASCSTNYTPMLSMASSETNGGRYNMTNAHVGNYSAYQLNVCCTSGNSPPSVPVLLSPANGNASVFERQIPFDWQDSTDPDSDPITYEWNLTNRAGCANLTQTGLATSTYTSAELCTDIPYNWSVRACDLSLCSAWSGSWNFTILSVIGIRFTVNATSFGNLTNGANENTSDGSPAPFTVENTGNVDVNVTVLASDALFDSVALSTIYWQYKARQNEASAYGGASQTSYANLTAAYTALFTTLNYEDVQDSAFVDLNVTVPAAEGGGAKTGVVNISASVFP